MASCGSGDAIAHRWKHVPSQPTAIAGLDQVPSPALLVFFDRLEANLREMIRIAGSPERLRPHCKTHKIAEIIQLQLAAGIERHKCATIAEAEMLLDAGVRDVFLAYAPVGPNLDRIVALSQRHPHAAISISADHPVPLEALSARIKRAGRMIGVVIDLDAGMHRTGIPLGEQAKALYRKITELPGLATAGFQLYDGHHRQLDLDERRAAVRQVWDQTASLADSLQREGYLVPRIIAGGTGTFPCYAEINDSRLELSPGTVLFHDAGYLRAFPDLDFAPAAVLLTRVISLPGTDRLTVDLGHKACAADPPAGKRLWFPAHPDAQELIHSEEHLVLGFPGADQATPGDMLFAIPSHICPTTALHQEVVVIRNQAVAERWQVVARNRRLTI